MSDSQCCCLYVLVCSLAFCLQWSRIDCEAPRIFLSGAPQSVVMYLHTWLFQSTKICSHCHQTTGSEIHFYLDCASDFPILFFILVVPCSVLAAYPQISRFNEIQHFSVTHWKYWRVLDLGQILTQCILVWKWWSCCGDARGCSVHLIAAFLGLYILLIRMSDTMSKVLLKTKCRIVLDSFYTQNLLLHWKINIYFQQIYTGCYLSPCYFTNILL